MHKLFTSLACFCAFLLDVQDVNASLQTSRGLFLKAEQSILLNRKSEYQQYAAQLQQYPLLPYLESLYWQKSLTLKNKGKIEQFLQRHRSTPYAKQLREKWLNYLAKNKFRKPYLDVFEEIGDPKLTCTNLYWQLNPQPSLVNVDEIMAQVTDIWVNPKSLPRECDPLFELWKKAGHLTPDVALERYILAAKKRNYGLLPYLKGLLSTSDRHIANMWRSVAASSSSVFKGNFFLLYNDKETDVFLYGLNRQAFVNPEKVSKYWDKLSHKFQIDKAEQRALEKKLALSFAIQNHKDALSWLTKLPDESVDDGVKQWRLAYALDNADWQQTLNIVTQLPEQMQTDSGVVYWKARALENLGEQNWAKDVYQELSERRSYYGFLAAGKLDKPVKLRHESIAIDTSLQNKVKHLPAMQRAIELFKLNRANAARKEWNLLLTQLSEPEQLVAAKVAYDSGWYSRAIFTLPRLGYFNDVTMRFPLAYKQLLSHAAQKEKLDPAFVFAIARRESSFMHDAFSSAGAAGLMQIKPSTASYVAKKKVYKSQLFTPERNVNLGSHYLSELLAKSNGNPIIATASYNAGFSRVKRWLPDESTPADVWIETIPYKETRNYVKAVVAYSKVYQQLLNRNNNLFDGMTDLAIKPSL